MNRAKTPLLSFTAVLLLGLLGVGGPALGKAKKPAKEKKADATRPIADTHIHLFQVTRPGGVPWPPPANKTLYRDVLPAEYKALAQKSGVIATGIMEASPIHADNLKLLEMTKG